MKLNCVFLALAHARAHTPDQFEAGVVGSVPRLRYFSGTSLRQKRVQKCPGVRERGTSGVRLNSRTCSRGWSKFEASASCVVPLGRRCVDAFGLHAGSEPSRVMKKAASGAIGSPELLVLLTGRFQLTGCQAGGRGGLQPD